ncbi:MAG: hypothetical protein K8L99_03500, partial [Anaerolineae bacterium]|nr:hypothetical protein [Anaerolineae bacterium]
MLAPLPETEITLSNLVVELLLLEKSRKQRYRGLLLDDPEDNRCVRLTMHYVMALLAYGFSPTSNELQELAAWFDRPYPKRENDDIDPLEMNRLLVLLHLRPENDNVQTRLQQLVHQRVDEGFDVQPSWTGYDTLWALEIVRRAHDQGVLDKSLVDIDSLKSLLPCLIKSGELKRDKDIALAANLQYSLFGELFTDQIERLIKVAEDNRGVWGLEELGWRLKDMDWLDKFVQSNKLIPEDVRAFQNQFRRVLLSTCMVVEYLLPLLPQCPNLQQPLEKAMHLCWDQFYGQHAITTLHALFPHPYEYDYVLVLCRIMRTLRQYLGQPICTLDSVQLHILRELAEERHQPEDPPEIYNIKQALRHWIRVDLDGEPEALKLGFSEANVVRVRPHIWSPMFNDPQAANSLISQSLIIKYGPSTMIKKERANYERLPAAVRDCFVRIPEASYTDPQSDRAFVIMQDLRNYKTLYEIHEAISHNVSEVADQLGPFLRRMHEGGSERRPPVSTSLLREIYLRQMMENVDRIFDFVWDN